MKRRFRAKDKEYRKRAKELEEVTTRRDAVRKEFDELRKKRLTRTLPRQKSLHFQMSLHRWRQRTLTKLQ